MKNKPGHKHIPLSLNRQMVIASASVTSQKNAIHSITEVDVTMPRKLIRKHFDKTGEKLSFTAYIVTCFAHSLKGHPKLNSFIKGRRLIMLDDVTISVLIEKEIEGENVPEPLAIMSAQDKNLYAIHQEIRKAQNNRNERLGIQEKMGWIRLIPGFLLKTFVRIADRNIRMAKKYGKVAVTAVGMYSKEPVWFIPHGTATTMLTVGSIQNKVVKIDDKFEEREHLCITVSFDHNIIDGAPATRFMNDFIKTVKSGELIKIE